VGIPLALLTALFIVLGIRDYNDIDTKIQLSKQEINAQTITLQRDLSDTVRQSEQNTMASQQELSQTIKTGQQLVSQAQQQLANVQEVVSQTQQQLAGLQLTVNSQKQEIGNLDNRLQTVESRIFTFENPSDISPEIRASIETSLNYYVAYWQELGIELKNSRPITIVVPSDFTCGLACYDDESGTMILESTLFSQTEDAKDVVLREFTHYVLRKYGATGVFSDTSDEMRLPYLAVFESGLADYFPASFLGSPKLSFERSLDSDLTLDDVMSPLRRKINRSTT